MELRLRVLEGKSAGQEVPVPVNRFFIGRAEDCHMRPASDMVSRHHCALMVEDGYVGVRDFGSKNGTYVNGERVAGERELKAGDRLHVGPLKFEIVLNLGIGTKKLPPVHDVREAVARTAEAKSSKDVDVDQWLTEPAADAVTSSPATKDTARISLGDTDTIRLGTTQTLPPGNSPPPMEEPVTAGAADVLSGPHAPPDEKKQPGKFMAVKAEAKDSKSAAANFLDQMRRRR